MHVIVPLTDGYPDIKQMKVTTATDQTRQSQAQIQSVTEHDITTIMIQAVHGITPHKR